MIVNYHPSSGVVTVSVQSVDSNPTGELISNMSVNYHPSSEVLVSRVLMSTPARV